MAKQVSGSEKTLIAAIEDGDVQRPALMGWNEWQSWRSTAGRMPRMGVDGYSVTRAQESALWKSVMLDLYGDDWSFQLVVSKQTPQKQMLLNQMQPQPELRHRHLSLQSLHHW